VNWNWCFRLPQTPVTVIVDETPAVEEAAEKVAETTTGRLSLLVAAQSLKD